MSRLRSILKIAPKDEKKFINRFVTFVIVSGIMFKIRSRRGSRIVNPKIDRRPNLTIWGTARDQRFFILESLTVIKHEYDFIY